MPDPVINAINLKAAKKGFKGAIGTLDNNIRSHPFKRATGQGPNGVPNPGITGKGKTFSVKDKAILGKKRMVG